MPTLHTRLGGPAPSPFRPSRSARVWGTLLTVLSAAAILLVTLTPAGVEHQMALRLRFCLACGEFGLANLLRNVVLFVPLGVGLGLLYRRPLRAWLPAIFVTAFIETAQIFIPGRNPLPADFLANAAGGGLGVLLVLSLSLSLSLRGATTGWARAATALWAALPFLALLGTAYAFRIVPPPPPHHIQIAPNLGHLDAYRGEVRPPTLGGETLRIGRHPNPAALEAALLGGATLEVEVGPAPATRRVAPIVSVYTRAQRELFLFGVHREDLVLRLPYRAASLGLHRSDLRLPGGREVIGERPETRLAYWMETGGREGTGLEGVCLEAADERVCGLRPGLREGWSLLHYPAGLPAGARTALGWGWLLGLGGAAGLMAGSLRRAVLLGVALVGTAALAPPLTGSFVATGVTELLVLVGGTALGKASRKILPSGGTDSPSGR